MKINAAVTLLIDGDGARLEIMDHAARVDFVKINLTAEQLCAALGRLACVRCEAEVVSLDKVGKVHENKTLEFPLPRKPEWSEREEMAFTAAEAACPDGWVPDNYFRSQGSFFEKDGKPWARATIRRWVPKDDAEVRR